MRPVMYQNTPQGFRIPLYDTQRRADGPDELVMTAQRTLLADTTGVTHTWEWQRHTVNRILDLFGDFREFLRAQEDNSTITVHQRLFLEDTVDYINTGTRKMSIESRLMLLAMEANERSPSLYQSHRGERTLAQLLRVPHDDYMYHWLTHDGGFSDMVCTANGIFGSLKGPFVGK